MLRMGRNAKGEHVGHTTDTGEQASPQHAASSYATNQSSSTTTSGNYQGPVQTPTTTRAVTESESLARDIKEGTLSGFVGNGTVLSGEATFKGMLRIDGHLSGRISSTDGTLIVSTNGRVDANIEVAVAQIYGTVNGDITATKRIELGRVARLTGNIEAPALSIEPGAIFEGSCRMVHLRDEQDKQRHLEEEHRLMAYNSPAQSQATHELNETHDDVADLSEVAS